LETAKEFNLWAHNTVQATMYKHFKWCYKSMLRQFSDYWGSRGLVSFILFSSCFLSG